ncbi:MAG: pyridoxamine 5'-phosphate oxidase family protein [Anaerolineales bacterium]
MNTELFSQAVAMAQERQHVFITTADARGWPHLTSVGEFALASDRHIDLSDWFCPLVEANLQQNPKVTIVVWDIATDRGYQMLGEVETVTVLEGILHPHRDPPTFGQSAKSLRVRVDQVLLFSHAPHDDVEPEKTSDYLFSAKYRATVLEV